MGARAVKASYLSTVEATIDTLAWLGIDLETDAERVVARYERGVEPPPDALPLLDCIRAHREAAMESLQARGAEGWNEARARGRLEGAFDWADQVSPSSCWRWLLEHGHHEHQERLDRTYDAIDSAFRSTDTAALTNGLAAFRDAVTAAIVVYRSAAVTSERVAAHSN